MYFCIYAVCIPFEKYLKKSYSQASLVSFRGRKKESKLVTPVVQYEIGMGKHARATLLMPIHFYASPFFELFLFTHARARRIPNISDE